MRCAIVAYKDTELEKFQPAFLIPQGIDEIVEAITDAAIKGKVEDCAHKELYLLGYFETTDGSFELQAKPVLALDCKSFAKEVNG